jgi:hypothetical protein
VARRARTAAGLVAILATLAIVAAAVTALPPAAGAAAPLRPSRTAASSAAFDRLPAAIVVLVGTVRPVPHQTRPHPSSSAALHRSPRHAFRAAPPAGHPTTLLIVLVVPARGPRAPRCGAEWTDRFAVAGGDPVNEEDPSGEAWCLKFLWGALHCWGTTTPPLPAGGTTCEPFQSSEVNQDGVSFAVNPGDCQSGFGPVANEIINYWQGSWDGAPPTPIQTETALNILASTSQYVSTCQGDWLACLQYWVAPPPSVSPVPGTETSYVSSSGVAAVMAGVFDGSEEIVDDSFGYWLLQLMWANKGSAYATATNVSDAAEVTQLLLEAALYFLQSYVICNNATNTHA